MYAMLAVSLAMAGYKVYQGIKAKNEAEKEGDKVTKTEIPLSAKTALAESQNMSMARTAGAASAEKSLKEAAATAAYRAERGATNSSQVQSAVSGTQAMESKGIRSIQAQEEMDTVARKNKYIDQLYQMAEMEKAVADENKQNRYNAVESTKSAGNQMIYSGLNSAASAVSMQMLMNQSNPTNQIKAPKDNTPLPHTATFDELNAMAGEDKPIVNGSQPAPTVDGIDPKRAEYEALKAKGGVYLSYEDWLLTEGKY